MRFSILTRIALVPLTAAILAGCGSQSLPLAATQSQGLAAQALSTDALPNPAQLKAMSFTDLAGLIDKPEKGDPDVTESCIWPCPPPGDLGNFGQVDDAVYRGARPTDAGMAKLKAMGVKTIVDLENVKSDVQHESSWCKANGMSFVSIPLSVFLPPKESMINQFLALASDPASTPLYVHCMQGRDRTGTAVFCYRVHHDHWTFNKAYSEMTAYHFHTYLLGLQYFIREYAKKYQPGQPVPPVPAPAAS
ncbi:MAG TPA: tyrosine-protein phosphatase [Oscillatoriaceae cyanobacterium]